MGSRVRGGSYIRCRNGIIIPAMRLSLVESSCVNSLYCQGKLKMKRILVIAAVAALTLAACGKEAPPPAPAPAPAPATAPAPAPAPAADAAKDAAAAPAAPAAAPAAPEAGKDAAKK